MGRRKIETDSIEKNLKKAIEEEKRLEKILSDAEKVAQKPVKEIKPNGEIIRIIKSATFVLITLFLLSFSNVQNKGVVKYYNEEKGFGYIIFQNDEVFVYEAFIIDEIKTGDHVLFDLRNTRKGYEAINVRTIK